MSQTLTPMDIRTPPPEDDELAHVGLHAISLHGWFRADLGQLYPGFPVGPEDVVADIGCGDGGASLFCARQGARVILSDLDADRLVRAGARVAAVAPGRVETRHGNGEALPIADATATRTICMEVIEHVEDPDALTAELFRITRPGGLLLLACPHPRSEAVQQEIAPPSYFAHPNHIRILQPEHTVQHLANAGFEIVRTDTYGFYEAVWWAMFWSTGVELGERHPVFDAWATTWKLMLQTKDGLRVQRALDSALPKSQVVIARRPA
ncbi:ubiquinone/menaquinone biosynthesis C-methylase UbiE [Endobacter medicaginis]|uniref:Methyltransferase domain-containing protein n=1 Tax=Endobacter medicaginis TaxID=1181271 RepID=A0A839UZR1_9PROT|nr:class I SAM-dependent methyltransferase [Endobacter medicaginis]MBB3172779.1 ubiquinone/menaquinone biosynthesis C-methylase UbiE [Endobacter medicaginis]MCX5474386.1 class I SAM-dependent methyltransferase [Endobacter medicaginis]NVN29787.1 methyltransferase domain-containing protein [Endobacter medicaginis]